MFPVSAAVSCWTLGCWCVVFFKDPPNGNETRCWRAKNVNISEKYWTAWLSVCLYKSFCSWPPGMRSTMKHTVQWNQPPSMQQDVVVFIMTQWCGCGRKQQSVRLEDSSVELWRCLALAYRKSSFSSLVAVAPLNELFSLHCGLEWG